MSKQRKTVDVSFVLERVNYFLENSRDDQAKERRGSYLVLESILMETGNYHGFNYLAWLNGGCDKWREDGSPRDNEKYLGDKTRRYYYSR